MVIINSDEESICKQHILDRIEIIEDNCLFWEKAAYILAPLNILTYASIQQVFSIKDTTFIKATLYGIALSIANFGVNLKWGYSLTKLSHESKGLDAAYKKCEELYNGSDMMFGEEGIEIYGQGDLSLGVCYLEGAISKELANNDIC